MFQLKNRNQSKRMMVVAIFTAHMLLKCAWFRFCWYFSINKVSHNQVNKIRLSAQRKTFFKQSASCKKIYNVTGCTLPRQSSNTDTTGFYSDISLTESSFFTFLLGGIAGGSPPPSTMSGGSCVGNVPPSGGSLLCEWGISPFDTAGLEGSGGGGGGRLGGKDGDEASSEAFSGEEIIIITKWYRWYVLDFLKYQNLGRKVESENNSSIWQVILYNHSLFFNEISHKFSKHA